MWVISWKNYRFSKFATFLSVIAAMLRYAGVACLFSSVIPAGLICLAIGIGIHFAAEAIANKKANLTAKPNSTATIIPNVATTKSVNSSPAPNVVEKQKKCIRCGAIVKNDSKFCHECGYEVK